MYVNVYLCMDTKQCRGLLLLGFRRAMHKYECAFRKLRLARCVEHTESEHYRCCFFILGIFITENSTHT